MYEQSTQQAIYGQYRGSRERYGKFIRQLFLPYLLYFFYLPYLFLERQLGLELVKQRLTYGLFGYQFLKRRVWPAVDDLFGRRGTYAI